MNSDDLTHEQAAHIHQSLFRLANYLFRLTKRMERTGFPPNDPLYVPTKLAYDAVCSLYVDFHYRSCRSGVASGMKPETEERKHGRLHPHGDPPGPNP